MIRTQHEDFYKICNKFIDFMDGTRVSMLINRSVGNTNKGSKRWINKLISTNIVEFADNIKRLLAMQYYLNDPDIRLYSCVNMRRMDKAINHFNHAQLDIPPDQTLKFYSTINNKFCSSLMQPENKAERLFLIDIDQLDTSLVDTILTDNSITVLLAYRTVKGIHFVTKPFNPICLENIPNVEIKKDGLLLLNSLEGQK